MPFGRRHRRRAEAVAPEAGQEVGLQADSPSSRRRDEIKVLLAVLDVTDEMAEAQHAARLVEILRALRRSRAVSTRRMERIAPHDVLGIVLSGYAPRRVGCSLAMRW